MWFSMLTVEAVKPELPPSLNGLYLFAYFGHSPCCWNPLALPAAGPNDTRLI